MTTHTPPPTGEPEEDDRRIAQRVAIALSARPISATAVRWRGVIEPITGLLKATFMDRGKRCPTIDVIGPSKNILVIYRDFERTKAKALQLAPDEYLVVDEHGRITSATRRDLETRFDFIDGPAAELEG